VIKQLKLLWKVAQWVVAWRFEDGDYILKQTIRKKTRFGMIEVPKGFQYDGMTCFPDGPHGELLRVAAIHDFCYETAWFNRIDSDMLLREEIIDVGIALGKEKEYTVMADIVFKGVRKFGLLPWMKARVLQSRKRMEIV